MTTCNMCKGLTMLLGNSVKDNVPQVLMHCFALYYINEYSHLFLSRLLVARKDCTRNVKNQAFTVRWFVLYLLKWAILECCISCCSQYQCTTLVGNYYDDMWALLAMELVSVLFQACNKDVTLMYAYAIGHLHRGRMTSAQSWNFAQTLLSRHVLNAHYKIYETLARDDHIESYWWG